MSRLTSVYILFCCGFLSLVKYAALKDSSDPGVLTFVKQPSDITVAEQTNAVIPCMAVGVSPITYSWTHNDTPLTLNSRTGHYRLMEADGNFFIINATLNDEGEYRCIASSDLGSMLSLKAEVRIAFLHVSNHINNTITAALYSSVKFSVDGMNSFPKAQFTWQVRTYQSTVFDDIADGENGRLLISQAGDLYITGARKEDSGAYRCLVTNPVVEKEIDFDFALNVLEGAVDRPLSFLLPPVTTEVTAGTARVVLECFVRPVVERGSLEIPLITWHKNDKELDPIRDPKYSYPNGGSSHHKLVINDVEIKDSDWYSCIATTRSTVITSPQAQLIVNHKPVVPWFQPGFPSVIQSFAGTDLTIDCNALGGDVTWYKNAISIQSLSNPRMSVSANGSLLIQNATHVDGGLYQVFARTSVDEVCSPPITLDILEWPPLTTLAPVTSTVTRCLSTEVSSGVPTQYTTDNRVPYQPSLLSFLYRKQTTKGSAMPLGTENKGKMMLIYGTVTGGVLFLLLVVLAMFCYKRQTGRRLRKGSIRLKSHPDSHSEQFEMKPVEPRAMSSPPRPITVRRFGNSESIQDLPQSREPNQHRVSLLSTDNNRFIGAIESEDHPSAHVNPALINELAIISPSTHGTNDALQEYLFSSFELEQSPTFTNSESEDLNDSGMEEETSEIQKLGIPLESIAKKCIKENISCRLDNRVQDKNNGEVLIEGRVTEPLYHVLEQPGDDRNNQGETGDDKVETANFYQSLRQSYQDTTEDEHRRISGQCADGYLKELISSSTELYQSLTPPNYDNGLNDVPNLNQDNKDSTSPSQGIYQSLSLNSEVQSHLLLNNETPRSISGVYQSLNKTPIVRCWSAPQKNSKSQVTPESTRPANLQAESDPIYQTVDEQERCPLNLDDPGSSIPQGRRRTPRASPLEQRRTIQEPLFIAVEVGSSPPNRRICQSEYEPRYSPSPCWKSSPTPHPPVRGHRRNFSDGGRAVSSMVNTAGRESTSASAERRAPNALPRHLGLGHRRNRSDVALCPIDRSQESVTTRLTSVSDSGLPRTPSLGSLATGEYSRSAVSDTTHCAVHIGP